MAGLLALDRLIDELLESAKHFAWPEDAHNVRESWAAAIEQNPSILADLRQDYVELVKDFFYDLSALGIRMSSISSGDLSSNLAAIKMDVERHSADREDLMRKYNEIMGVLNLSNPTLDDYNALQGVARAYLIFTEGIHDISNVVGAAGLYSPNSLEDYERKSLEAAGRHASLVGAGGANMLVYGPIMNVILESDIFRVLKRLFEIEHSGIRIEYEGSSVGIKADMPNLYRCFYNLARNAVLREKQRYCECQ